MSILNIWKTMPMMISFIHKIIILQVIFIIIYNCKNHGIKEILCICIFKAHKYLAIVLNYNIFMLICL